MVEAEQQGLSEGDRKRFFPVEMQIHVLPENWNPLDDRVSYFGSDVGWSNSGIHVGHKSASGAVAFIIKHFPLEGTKEALPK